MSEVSTIGLDIAKNVFHAHGTDTSGRPLFSRKISRTKLLDFFAQQPRCLVALEACGGAHHWARELTQQGHKVKLIPPAYVKPLREAEQERCGRCRSHLRSRAATEHAVCGDQERRATGLGAGV